MNRLGLKFSATNCNGWPKLKFYIDDDLYQDYKFTEQFSYIEIPLDLINGSHYLDIELYNKTIQNTVQIEGKIVDDQLVTLESIFIDDVRLPDFVKYRGVYWNGQESMPQALTWGQNGTWRLEFMYPIIDWVLHIKQNEFAEFDKNDEWATSTLHSYKLEILNNELKKLENLLTNVKN